MSNKTFIKILLLISVAGLLLTIAHAVYIYYAYTNSSIIYFISKEIWF
ncbi:hypothetical protein [Butyrivibrio fibrisolvens]|nr:hypothetical protein [Butyrivibrio fibrisolvens]